MACWEEDVPRECRAGRALVPGRRRQRTRPAGGGKGAVKEMYYIHFEILLKGGCLQR